MNISDSPSISWQFLMEILGNTSAGRVRFNHLKKGLMKFENPIRPISTSFYIPTDNTEVNRTMSSISASHVDFSSPFDSFFYKPTSSENCYRKLACLPFHVTDRLFIECMFTKRVNKRGREEGRERLYKICTHISLVF